MHKTLYIDIDKYLTIEKNMYTILTILLNTKVVNLFVVNKFNYFMIKSTYVI